MAVRAFKQKVRMLVALIGATIVVTAMISPATPAVANVRTDDGVDPASILGACDPLASSDDDSACDPADNLPDPQGIVDAIMSSSSASRFVDWWIDRSGSTPVDKFEFVDATPADQAVLTAAAGSGVAPLAVSVNYSLDKLQSAVGLVLNVVNLLGLSMMSYIDAETNSLIVKIADDSLISVSTLTDVLDLVLTTADLPTGLLSVSGGYVEPSLTGLRTTYPPHTGGLEVDVVKNGTTTGHACTTGFTILTDSGQMGVTAGHCANGVPLSDQVSIGSHYLSHAGMNTFVGHSSFSSDSMRYSIPGNNGSRLMLVGGSTSSPTYRKVMGPRFTMTTLKKGVRVCFQGINSGNNNCGNVSKPDAKYTYNGKTMNHMFTMGVGSYPGDSGGPVYHVRPDGTAQVAGITTLANGSSSGVSTSSIFSEIGYVLSDLDASLYSY